MNPNPLTKADLANANSGIYECRVCEQEIERAKACGLDCAEQEARMMHLKNFFQQVLLNYPPQMKPS